MARVIDELISIETRNQMLREQFYSRSHSLKLAFPGKFYQSLWKDRKTELTAKQMARQQEGLPEN